jgi:lipid II:glycine glycyltransferase (peptidoglycan interpeptide bridge formation enzyme)/dTDP-4-amino-4,6-dideoxygalactose transaminase
MFTVTTAPLPQWRHLLITGKTQTGDEALTRPWCGEGDYGICLSRSTWSLALITRWLEAVNQKTKITLWIPEYFCNSALDKVRHENVSLVFYPLLDTMEPDIQVCRELALTVKPDIFLLVHYFGKPASASETVAFCTAQQALLVEDAAHVLRPESEIGSHGDMVLYSPHKHLPIYDGALLIIRDQGPVNLDAETVHSNISTLLRNETGPGWKTLVSWWLKKCFQKIGIRRLSFPDTFDLHAEASASLSIGPNMSMFSRKMLSGLTDLLEQIAEKRRENHSIWVHLLHWINNRLSVEEMGPYSSPYMVNMACNSPTTPSVSLYKAWLQCAVPVSTWPDLPPEVVNNSKQHKNALAWRNNSIFLPCHQSLSIKSISSLALKMKSAITRNHEWEISELDSEQWHDLFDDCAHANLLQSWEYGTAKEETGSWQAIRLGIGVQNGKPLAITQVLIRRIGSLVKIARINRGPLMLGNNGENSTAEILDVIGALRAYAKKQRWLLLQIAPEIPSGRENSLVLSALGYRHIDAIPWGSALISLDRPEQDLLMSLKGKWRNGMRKAIKNGLVVRHCANQQEAVERLVSSYEELQQEKNFAGLSEPLINSLARQQGNGWEFSVFLCYQEEGTTKKELGTLLTLRTGDTCIYVIGTTTSEGRRLQANSLLLWQAVLYARDTGCNWFDVGGLNADTPKGIAEFKSGLNPMPYTLSGEWRMWNLPFIGT